MNSEIETDEWKLKAFFEWVPKYSLAPCKNCAGTGSIGGGFKSFSGEESCPSCNGAGAVSEAPKSARPPIPPGLQEHMRRAWWDYVNKERAS